MWRYSACAGHVTIPVEYLFENLAAEASETLSHRVIIEHRLLMHLLDDAHGGMGATS